MKPAWEKLMAEFKGNPSALVADVDCTAGGKDLCGTKGVRGYPTIKYGDPDDLQDYKGGRTFDDLQKFASENLKPNCGPANLDLCDADKKAKIEELQALPQADLEAQIAEKTKEIKDAETTFEGEIKALQNRYEELQKEKDAAVAAVKEGGLGLMQSVLAHAKKAKSEL